MDWLVRFDFEKQYSHTIYQLALEVPSCQRFRRTDIDWPPIPTKSKLYRCDWADIDTLPLDEYLSNTKWLKIYLISPFLRHAPKSFSLDLLKHWLTDKQYTDVRQLLYGKTYHPLSTEFYERFPWNIPFQELPELLPDPERNMCVLPDPFPRTGDKEAYDLTPSNNVPAWAKHSLPEMSDSYSSLFQSDSGVKLAGRTLVSEKQTIEGRYYLKIKRRGESDTEFKKQYVNLKTLRSLDLLESKIPEPVAIMTVGDLRSFLDATSLNRDEISKLWLHIFGSKEVSHQQNAEVLLMRSPFGIDYTEYIYNGSSEEAIIQGLSMIARDYGRLWKRNITGPDLLSAFHDISTSRPYHFAATLNGYDNVGTIDSWAEASTNHPNGGPWPLSMRDSADSQPLSGASSSEKNKERISKLTNHAWGLVLLYGRSFKETFNHKDAQKISITGRNVKNILADLFTESFSLPRAQWLNMMEEFDLIKQVSREMNYWMADPAAYVEDVRKGYIPETVYPDWTGSRHVPSYQLIDSGIPYLSDRGFTGKGNTVHLGGRNGRNSLLSLDALIIRMITTGVVTEGSASLPNRG